MEDRGEEASQQIRADRTQHWSARVLRSGALAWLLTFRTVRYRRIVAKRLVYNDRGVV